MHESRQRHDIKDFELWLKQQPDSLKFFLATLVLVLAMTALPQPLSAQTCDHLYTVTEKDVRKAAQVGEDLVEYVARINDLSGPSSVMALNNFLERSKLQPGMTITLEPCDIYEPASPVSRPEKQKENNDIDSDIGRYVAELFSQISDVIPWLGVLGVLVLIGLGISLINKGSNAFAQRVIEESKQK